MTISQSSYGTSNEKSALKSHPIKFLIKNMTLGKILALSVVISVHLQKNEKF